MTSKIRVKIIGFQPDSDQMTGEPYTQVVFAVESKMPPPPPQMAQVYPPIPRAMSWKHIIHLMVPNSKWHSQYQMWQEYDLEIDQNTGELNLKLAKDGV